MLNRRQLLMGLGATCVVDARVLAAEPRLMTAADVHVDGYPTVAAMKWMGEKIARETAGRVIVRVYHTGQLGREADTIDLARFGAVDITRISFAGLANP